MGHMELQDLLRQQALPHGNQSPQSPLHIDTRPQAPCLVTLGSTPKEGVTWAEKDLSDPPRLWKNAAMRVRRGQLAHAKRIIAAAHKDVQELSRRGNVPNAM